MRNRKRPTVAPIEPTVFTLPELSAQLKAIAADIDMGAPGAVLRLHGSALIEELGFQLEALALAKIASGE